MRRKEKIGSARRCVVALQNSCVDQEERRQHLWQRRQRQLRIWERNQKAWNLEQLYDDIHGSMKSFSIAEQNLFATIDRAAQWWGTLCDHAIEHQLQCELAAQSRKTLEADYLDSTIDREKVTLKTILDNDIRRWKTAKEKLIAIEKKTQQEVVQEAIETVLQLSDNCATALSACRLESREETNPSNCMKTSVFANFIVDNVVHLEHANPSGDTLASSSPIGSAAEQAFKVIFCGKNPFAFSSLTLLQILFLAHQRFDSNITSTRFFFDFSNIPIVALNGPKLSGKSLVAKHIASKFGFHSFTTGELVQKALAACHASAGSPAALFPTSRDNQTRDEWCDVGRTLEALLQSGEAIPSALVIQLVCMQLCDLHLHSSPVGTSYNGDIKGLLLDGIVASVDVYKHLQKTLMPAEVSVYTPVVERWLEHPLSVQPLFSSEELAEVDEGWLPAALCMPKLRLEEVAVVKETKSRISKRSIDVALLPPPTLPAIEDVSKEIARQKSFIRKAMTELAEYRSFISDMICIDCTPEEVFKRFAGMKVDQETGAEYHMLYHPPPPDRASFLMGVGRTEADTAQLADLVLTQEWERKKFRSFIASGPQSKTMSRVCELPGEVPISILLPAVERAILNANENFVAAQNLFKAMKESQQRVRELEARRAQQVAEREAERRRLAALYTEKGVTLPLELEFAASFNPFNEAGGQPGRPGVLPSEVDRIILESIRLFTPCYMHIYATAWTCLSSLTTQLMSYRTVSMDALERFMFSSDDKQGAVDRFVKQFNSLPQLVRSDAVCKEEAHVQVEVLSDALNQSVAAKKKDWHHFAEAILRRDTFMESWEGVVSSIAVTLAQTEAERFVMATNIIVFFFGFQFEENPSGLEETEFDINPLASVLSASTAQDSLEVNSRSERKRATSAKKYHVNNSNHTAGKGTDDGVAKPGLEAFEDMLQRLSAALGNFVEKYKPINESTNKNQRKTVAPNTARTATITSRCFSYIKDELTQLMERLQCVRTFMSCMLDEGERYRRKFQAEMLAEIKNTVRAQASAVNTAVYVLRCCIEEEREAPSLHLGCGTFAVLNDSGDQQDDEDAAAAAVSRRQPSFLTDVPLYQDAPEGGPRVHAALTFRRLKDMIASFSAVAPHYQLAQDDFMRVVRMTDYDVAAGPTQSDARMRKCKRAKATADLFYSFDLQHVGLVDWREFVVHLLFWCTPPPPKDHSDVYFVEEVSLGQLQRSKEDLGSSPLTEEDFYRKFTFLGEHVEADRVRLYAETLWLTFHDPHTLTLDPTTLLLFLCADAQHIRGAQKAFQIAGCDPVSAQKGLLTKAELYQTFHRLATNPASVGFYDSFSMRNIELLFQQQQEAMPTISFDAMCGCLMGRVMLNKSTAFSRKSFVHVDVV